MCLKCLYITTTPIHRQWMGVVVIANSLCYFKFDLKNSAIFSKR